MTVGVVSGLSDVVGSSVLNAEALWRAFAAARGHAVVDEPGWVAVDAGGDAGGTRVILLRPVSGAAQCESLHRLVLRSSQPVTVEDPFGSVDLSVLGFVPRPLSVMQGGPIAAGSLPEQNPPQVTVRRVQGREQWRLLEADRIVVDGFPRLSRYQPYRPGRMLPAGLLAMPHVSVFVADFLGTPAGACLTVKDSHGVGGVYWLAVLAERRRAGIGRALMLAAMKGLAGLPMVLSATEQGAPLYRTLGFETAIQSTYWQGFNFN